VLQVKQEAIAMLDNPYQNLSTVNFNKGKRSSANVILLDTQQNAQNQAYADAATCGARVFLCHLYEQGKRTHLTFSLPFNLLLEMARLQTADTRKTNLMQRS